MPLLSLHSLLSTAAQPRALVAALAMALLSACQSAPPADQGSTAASSPTAAEASASRVAETSVPEAPVLGSHTDLHGCKPSTGHAWCQRTQRCERPWELALQRGFENTPAGWQAYCDGAKP